MLLFDTEDKQTQFVKKPGNIITFKDGITGRKSSQFLLKEFRKTPAGVRIEDVFGGALEFPDLEYLLSKIDWDWMEANISFD